MSLGNKSKAIYVGDKKKSIWCISKTAGSFCEFLDIIPGEHKVIAVTPNSAIFLKYFNVERKQGEIP